jgi:hypothetical protein
MLGRSGLLTYSSLDTLTMNSFRRVIVHGGLSDVSTIGLLSVFARGYLSLESVSDRCEYARLGLVCLF